jgi:inorganic phosphate transporter, PiT family
LTDLLFYVAVGVTFCFAFVNGFHDGGNVIATAISSRSIRPTVAIVLAAVAEFIGPLVLGTAVARTMATGILKPELLETLAAEHLYLMVISGVGGAIFWKLPTWFLGLPSSGSHALIGGLVGAGLVTLGIGGVAFDRVARSVVLPLLLSPFISIWIGYVVFSVLKTLLLRAHRGVGQFFAMLQKPTMVFLAASHGSNDAQKSMGVIALILAAGSGEMHGELHLPAWVIVSCAAALALGMSTGGWRIVKTVGYGISRMEPIHSFASHVSATSVIITASLLGGPVSTTQVVASSVMGVGASRRLSGVRWSAATHIAYAWLLTVPVSAALGAAFCWILLRLAAG